MVQRPRLRRPPRAGSGPTGPTGPRGPVWPNGHRFAFSIVDDTDKTTLENGPLVYDVLTELGVRATKTVWPLAPDGAPRTGGSTCADPSYLRWVLDLQAAGHEIGYHNASDHPSKRARTTEALDAFRSHFGHDPRIGADHSANLEALYWGHRRLTGVRAQAYRAAGRVLWEGQDRSHGHDPSSEYFWGDLCLDRIDYWRNFTFRGLDLLAVCPQVPYHDPARPFVRWWYAATHAPHLQPFLDALASARVDALERAGGACILYTHFGTNFVWEGELDQRFGEAVRSLADRDVWFAPASEILDHIRLWRAESTITDAERAHLERRWVRDQVQIRGRSRIRRVLGADR